MLDINGWEFILLAFIAVVVLGPERLPEYAAKLAKGIRQLREFANQARSQLKDEMGPEFDDVNWRAYDPRQYDPRKIVREALADVNPLAGVNPHDFNPLADPKPQSDEDTAAGDESAEQEIAPTSYDAARATPYDADAT